MNLGQIMIQCGAPSLCGIKPANLFSVRPDSYSRECVEFWRAKVHRQGLSFKEICTVSGLILFYIYDYKWISSIISDEPAHSYLLKKGYPVQDGCRAVLESLFSRLESSPDFPHEIGLFLGYPLFDVVCFEKNGGRGCKFTGYWKAYGNVEAAKRTCMRYKECSMLCSKWYEEGINVPAIVQKYKTAVDAA